MLDSVKPYHKLGFSLHLLKKESKLPLEKGWPKAKRKKWAELERAFKPGQNIGAVLGRPVKTGGPYLAAIDCDIKGSGKKWQIEIEKVLDKIPGIKNAPVVLSGRGNGSKHIYVLTDTPIKPKLFYRSDKKVKVHMPSSTPSKVEIKKLSSEEIKKGIRIRPAFEISFMGVGQQIVLPPSIHPDTKKSYKWQSQITSLKNIPKVDLSPHYGEVKEKPLGVPNDIEVLNGKNIDVRSLGIKEEFAAKVESGEGVGDRSAALYSVILHMLHCGVSESNILNVLTNTEYFLGQTAYEHAKTKNRKRAATWIYEHSLNKALQEFDHSAAFDSAVEYTMLEGEESKTQELEMREDAESIGDWRDDISRHRADGSPKATHSNIKHVLRNVVKGKPLSARNLFSNDDTWLTKTPWGSKKGALVTDDDVVRIKDYLASKFRLETARDKINDVLTALCLENSYHPVREFLNTLEWDGVERLSTWLKDYCGAVGDDDVLDAFGVKTLVAMVKRIYEPGCKLDTVLVLEGRQDIGKSTVAEILASKKWFSDSDLDIGNKDAVVSMCGNWVIELGELSVLSKRDSEQLKQFISRGTDKIRPHYGRRLAEFPRQSIFIGTTNRNDYLKDPTGNRRFWPVHCTRVLFKELRRDRDQLLAEAKVLYGLGEQTFIDGRTEPELYEKIKKVQKSRVAVDEIESHIAEVLASDELVFNAEEFRILDILNSGLINGVRNDMQGQMRIANALKNLGYKKQQKMVKGIKGRWWSK